MAAQEKVFLIVPYRDKPSAIAAGAKWDRVARAWYIPDGVDHDLLKQWRFEHHRQHLATPSDPRQEFGRALAEAGLLLLDLPCMDGRRHRVPVLGGRSAAKDGMYIGFLDGHPAGHIQNFKSGFKSNWRSQSTSAVFSVDTLHRINDEQIEKFAARRARQEAQYAATSQRLAVELTQIQLAHPQHPYLVAKGLNGKNVLALQDRDARLVVPIFSTDPGDDHIWSVQRISNNGFKQFEKDGRVAGGAYVAFSPAMGGEEPPSPIIISEGWATSESIRLSVPNVMTVTAFSAGNLGLVSSALRERHPDRPIVIAGDDDHRTQLRGKPNIGKEAATRAAGAIRGHAAFPPFQIGRRNTDWNDIYKRAGSQVVKLAILDAAEIARSKLHHDPARARA